MGLFRLLFWIALIAVAIWLWRRMVRKPVRRKPEPSALPMVRCAHCGVHLPQDQAVQDKERWYCSRAHLEQDGKAGGH
ncbi:PP0621 family protein [Stutzerimonas stutzeri]|uniref:PP0621 family protein n=1 Tax=Stutzerimonas sp. S1 TaxID=3030652 RepID=UPI0022243BF9|nr:PP0621 family protein [Stutzerimonas sp. S1]MCW3147197.1 PP0621 family protein [Stutzerimonas sp. S1]